MAEDQPAATWWGPSVMPLHYLNIRSAYPYGQRLHKDGAILSLRFGNIVYPH
jgi:hypothetical protein